MAFYKALHVVEAMFVGLSMSRSTSHEDRDKKLRHERRFDHVFSQYRSLQTTSLIARYLSDSRGSPFSKFENYMPGATVLSEAVHHRLLQVEAGAIRLLPQNAADTLKSRLRRAQTLPREFAAAVVLPDAVAGDASGQGAP